MSTSTANRLPLILTPIENECVPDRRRSFKTPEVYREPERGFADRIIRWELRSTSRTIQLLTAAAMRRLPDPLHPDDEADP